MDRECSIKREYPLPRYLLVVLAGLIVVDAWLSWISWYMDDPHPKAVIVQRQPLLQSPVDPAEVERLAFVCAHTALPIANSPACREFDMHMEAMGEQVERSKAARRQALQVAQK